MIRRLSDDDRFVMKMVCQLAFPAILESLLVSLVNYIDTAMVGSLGPDATAAVACSNPVAWMLNSTIQAVAVGGTVTVAQAMGAQNREKMKKVSGQAFLASVAIAVTLMSLLLILGGKIPAWMGADPSIQADAAAYLRLTGLGLPALCLSMVFFAILRGAGDTKTPMKLNTLVNVSNVVGNFLLIFPVRQITVGSVSFTMWGAGLGVAGAALATTIARYLALIILMALMIRRTDVTLTLKGLKPDLPLMKEMLRIGFPTALERLAISGGQTFYVRVVSGLGTITLAAHQLALTAESISYMPANGFQIAATTLVGNAVGAKKYDFARDRAAMTFRIAAVFTFGMSLFLFFGSRFLIGLFTPSEAVVEQGSLALRIIAFAEIFYAMASIYTGALRGVGDSKQPFYVCLATMWGVRIPLAYLFIRGMNLGIAGAWLAMGTDLLIRGSLMLYRFHRGSWEARLRSKDALDALE